MSAPSILSFDIDLGRIHAWSSVSGRVCYNASELPLDAIKSHDVVLAEIASAVDYTAGNQAIAYMKRRWMLFNIFTITKLAALAPSLLVAPSSDWTQGMPEEIRHMVAGITGDNHDIREARAMQFFYKQSPRDWLPLEEYMAKIVDGTKTKKKAK